MNNHPESITGLALTIRTLGLSLMVASISTFVLVTIAYHYNKGQRKSDERVALVLSASVYLVIFTLMMVIISMNIHTILGDLYGDDFNSFWCIFRGYLLTLLPCTLYHMFVIQAFFRLCRIVYFSRRRLQSFRFYILVVPVQLLFAIHFTHPLVWQSEKYLLTTTVQPTEVLGSTSAKTGSCRHATYSHHCRFPNSHRLNNDCSRVDLPHHWLRASVDVSNHLVRSDCGNAGIEHCTDLCLLPSEVTHWRKKMSTKSNSISKNTERCISSMSLGYCMKPSSSFLCFVYSEEKRRCQSVCLRASTNEILQLLP